MKRDIEIIRERLPYVKDKIVRAAMEGALKRIEASVSSQERAREGSNLG